jgi:hypothetical protein
MVNHETAFKSPTTQAERFRTAREGIAKLMELQDQPINLIPVLKAHRPDHAHSGNTNLNYAEYTDYLRLNGLVSFVSLPLSRPVVDIGYTIDPRSNEVWQPEKVIELFPMIDFSCTFKSPNGGYFGPEINTTRSSETSSTYTVDIALGDTTPRSEEELAKFLERMTSKSVIFRIDEIFIANRALLDALLAARV